MLVLNRYLDEQIVIGDDIVITVLELREDRVRLGITAPAEVRVDREEIAERRRRDAQESRSNNQPEEPTWPR